MRLAPSTTWREACSLLEAAFTDAGLAEPQADARILVEEATGLRRSALLAGGDAVLGERGARSLESYAARRLAREPVFRIAGHREFWGLDLRITPDVLDPRPDTETLVAAALKTLAGHPPLSRWRILDLGTGSGALLCALLADLPEASGIGVDRSPAACAVARANVEACGLADRARIVEGDWSVAPRDAFDIVVSNPPYIASAEIAALDPEVRDYDPRLALDGGPDGLDAYRAICPLLPGLLSPSGHAVLEVGATQADAVAALAEACGLRIVDIAVDLGGHRRAVVAGFGIARRREPG